MDMRNDNDGTSQDARLPKALEAGYFQVDELSFENLLSMSARLASFIPYYDINNQKRGDWQGLFTSNSLTPLAMLLSVNVEQLKIDYRQYALSSTPEHLSYLVSWAEYINTWLGYIEADEHDSAAIIREKIVSLIHEELSGDFKTVYALLKENGEYDQNGLLNRMCMLGAVWGISVSQAASEDDHLANRNDIHGLLTAIFDSFFKLIVYMQSILPKYVEQRLYSQEHDPSMGLFLTFLMLYKSAQARINTFNERHLDFYYRDILKVQANATNEVNAYLTLIPDALSGPVSVEKGAVFVPGKDSALSSLSFVNKTRCVVNSARIESLMTLSFQRDLLISPEMELGHVTRIKYARIPVYENSVLRTYPLFGADAQTDYKEVFEDAQLGFALASEVFYLREGVRNIEITVNYSDPVVANPKLTVAIDQLKSSKTEARRILSDIYFEFLSYLDGREAFNFDAVARRRFAEELVSSIEGNVLRKSLIENMDVVRFQYFLLCVLKKTASKALFVEVVGKLINRSILFSQETLEDQEKQLIIEKAETLLERRSTKVIRRQLYTTRKSLVYSLFRRPFNIEVTVENGWYAIPHYALFIDERDSKLSIKFQLDSDVEPVCGYHDEIHQHAFGTTLPVMRFMQNSASRFFPYTFLQEFVVESLIADVDVSGARNIMAYNQHGRLDPSKPFSPFGPTPVQGSYLVLGYYEAAIKQLDSLTLKFNWKGLPRNLDGFENYYQAYEGDFSNSNFKVCVSSLLESNWMPDILGKYTEEELFSFDSVTGKLDDKHTISVETGFQKPLSLALDESEYQFDLNAKRGFIRLQLSSPQQGFAHQDYSYLLAQTLTENAKRRKQKPLPSPPYVPELTEITLDYRARHVVWERKTDEEREQKNGVFFYIHPFGIEKVACLTNIQAHHLLYKYRYDGNLFIGFSARRREKALSLYFELDYDSKNIIRRETGGIDWFYMSATGWKKFEDQALISDTTSGFIRSGIVVLRLPDDIVDDSSRINQGMYWLRIATNLDQRFFPNLYTIRNNAINVHAETNNALFTTLGPLANSEKWRTEANILGLSSIKQLGFFKVKKGDLEKQALYARVSERLRHRNRAVTPWDYERLILEKFPLVYKVKCFNHSKYGSLTPAPGKVLIMVIPYSDEKSEVTSTECSIPKLNAGELERIRSYVKSVASPFTEVDVRNPDYEQIQVRCTVVFSDYQLEGTYLQRLNQDISNYISSWQDGRYRGKFAWRFHREEVEAYVGSLDYVDFVTNFSMLHITQDFSDKYHLGDTALKHIESASIIEPTYPWNLALPMKQHFIETSRALRPVAANVTGIGELEVGSTFIITNGNQNGGKK